MGFSAGADYVSSQWSKVYGGFFGPKSGTFIALAALWQNIDQIVKYSGVANLTFAFFKFCKEEVFAVSTRNSGGKWTGWVL